MKKAVTTIKYLLLLGIGIFLLWLAFKGQDLAEIAEGFKDAHYGWVALSVFFGLLSHISRAMRWNMLIHPLGYKVSAGNSFIAIFMTYLANLALPRMGEVTRCIVLNRTDGVPVNKLFGTVIAERIIDLIVLLSIVFFTFLIEFNHLRTFFRENIRESISSKAASLIEYLTPLNILIIFAFLVVAFFLFRFFSKKKGQPSVILRLKILLHGFVGGLKSVKDMDNNLLFLGHTIFIWGMYYLMTYVAFFAFDFTSHLGPIAALVVFAIGSLGFIMPVQGGIGTFHLAVTAALAFYAVPETQGLTFATLLHAAQTVMILVGGGLCFLAFMLIMRKKRADENLTKNSSQNTQPA